MGKTIEPLRGVHDVLPVQAAAWQHLERTAREVFAAYGYEEFRVPIIEATQLFKRSIGDFTDIVEKEMFSFVDQGEDHITLRPEATAGIVRAVISNGLLRDNRLRVWCMGPMFRRERPQAGRYRQFHQLDVEAFGFAGPDIDAEMIQLSARLLRRLGLRASSSWSIPWAPRRRVPFTGKNSPPISATTKHSSTKTANDACKGTRCVFWIAKTPICSVSWPARRCCWTRWIRSRKSTSPRCAST